MASLTWFLFWNFLCLCNHVSLCQQTYEFKTTKESGSYTSAIKSCFNQGMTLITAKTPVDMHAVDQFMQKERINKDVWLGLTIASNSTDPADLTWADGTPITWGLWGELGPSSPVEPNHLDTDKCVIIQNSNRKWYTRKCRNKNVIICQHPAVFQTGYFTYMPTVSPNGTALAEISALSFMRCAALCIQTDACDFIYRHPSGTCRIFSSVQAGLVNKTNQSDRWRVYQRYVIET